MDTTHRLFYIHTYKSCVGFILISEQLHNRSNIPIGTEGLSNFSFFFCLEGIINL